MYLRSKEINLARHILRENYHAFLQLEKGLSQNSIDGYMLDFDKLDQFSKSINKDLVKLEMKDFNAFFSELVELGIAPRTQARILSGIKSFYKFLLVEDVIEDDPTSLLETPKLGRKLPDVLSKEEIDAMVQAVDLSKAEGQRNKAIIETLYGCGLRVSELINLQISNVYPSEEFVRVIGKGNKERLVPINQTALMEIDAYLKGDRNQLDIKPGHEDFVFLNRRGKQLTRVMIFTIVKNLAIMAGIKKEVSPHTFRHSFATHLLEFGANLRVIQQMLGHSSIMTTEIYTHMDSKMLHDTIEQFHPRAKKR